MADIKWRNAINVFNEALTDLRPIYTTTTTTKPTDTNKIWESPAPRIMWRNLTEEQKRWEYILDTTPHCEISSVIAKFVGIEKKNVILQLSSSPKCWPKLDEQLLQLKEKYEVIIGEEETSELENYNKVLVLTTPKDIGNEISAGFQGDQLICLFDPHSWSIKIKCNHCEKKISEGSHLAEILERRICGVCGMEIKDLIYNTYTHPHEIPGFCYGCGKVLWERGSLITPLEEFLSDFEEVRTCCGKLPKLFIRKFEDEISCKNAPRWYFNYLTEEERKEYTIITPHEEHKWNVQQEYTHRLVDDFKKNWNEIQMMRFSILPVNPPANKVLSILQKVHLYGGYPDVYERLKSEFGSHVPLEIEILGMLKFVGFAADVLGVFSGVAFIENVLKLKHVNIRATDDYSELFGVEPWMEVEKINAVEAIRKYQQYSVLFMSWPPKRRGEKEFHSDAFYALKEFKGSKLVFVGDSENCACKVFFQYLEDNFVCLNSGVTGSKVHFYIRRLKCDSFLRFLRRNMIESVGSTNVD